MIAFDDFKKKTVEAYQTNYGCGARMSADEIEKEFDLTIGRHGYAELERIEKLCEKRNEPFDPIKRACDQMDALI